MEKKRNETKKGGKRDECMYVCTHTYMHATEEKRIGLDRSENSNSNGKQSDPKR